MSDLATAFSIQLVGSVIGAVGSLVSACLLAWVALRGQSNDQLVQRFKDVLERELDDRFDPDTGGLVLEHLVKRALREVLGTRTPHRRWYER